MDKPSCVLRLLIHDFGFSRAQTNNVSRYHVTSLSARSLQDPRGVWADARAVGSLPFLVSREIIALMIEEWYGYPADLTRLMLRIVRLLLIWKLILWLGMSWSVLKRKIIAAFTKQQGFVKWIPVYSYPSLDLSKFPFPLWDLSTRDCNLSDE